MKRIALAGLLVSLVAGTATAQTPPPYGGYQSAPPNSSRVILKGVTSSEPVVPASAAAALAGISKPQEQTDGGSTELATCDKCGQAWTDCCCPKGCGWTIFADWMLLQPRGSDVVFATRQLNCVSPPIGVEQIDLGEFSSFRVGIAKALCDGCCDLAASFWMMDAHQGDTAAKTTGTDIIHPVLLFPGLGNITSCPETSSTKATADVGIDFQRVALDYRCRCDLSCFQLDWLVGFGYARLDQSLTAVFDEATAHTDIDLSGYGVRLGVGGTKSVGCFRGYTHADLTLLASNVTGRYRAVDHFDGITADFEQGLDRIVPILDLEVGLAYDLSCHTTLKFGYIYSIWWNVVTTPTFVHDVLKQDVTGNSSDTLTFDGAFVRLEINF